MRYLTSEPLCPPVCLPGGDVVPCTMQVLGTGSPSDLSTPNVSVQYLPAFPITELFPQILIWIQNN